MDLKCDLRKTCGRSLHTMACPRSYRGGVARALIVMLALAGGSMLAGCSSVVDHIPPAVGGLPEGVPQRPAGPTSYPAVHDMPPRRRETPLNEEEKKRLREDLASSRERAKAAPTAAEPK